MSKVIFLNGCGSSGKTSIAHNIQSLSDKLWLTFGVDTFIDMIPSSKQEAYFKFIEGKNNYGPVMHIETESTAKNLFNIMPYFAKMLADAGNNLIIDEVLLNDSSLKVYAESLNNHTVYYIGIFCDLKIMQEREISRGDRYIGLSNAQINIVHQGDLGCYDFKIDTSNISPFEATHQILEFIDNHPIPSAFKKMIS